MFENTSKKIILAIDDMAENIELLNNILKDDYIVKMALDAETGIKIAIEKIPDLILLDIVMPEIDGFKVCKILKENPKTKNIPIIFVTVKDDVIDEECGFRLGAVDYITKPFIPAIVKVRVKTHIALKDYTNKLEQLVELRTKEMLTAYNELINKLARAIEYKDNLTGQHINRMAVITLEMGKKIGLPNKDCELLYNSTLLHDIGKIGIPDDVLLKPGKLSEQEWELMKKHTLFGADIIGETNQELLKVAKVITLTHHEKWDGTGYPNGLKGEEIPLFGRIVALADVFDALIHTRPYKTAWKLEDALNLIKEQSGKHFDPNLVPIFLEIINELLKKDPLFFEDKK